ncbi:MAG: hypothetical protein GXP31_08850 [Kiritimatiellaeota bacterium]|nr:hypothetical protein [Kiritimatiellota bacterium]
MRQLLPLQARAGRLLSHTRRAACACGLLVLALSSGACRRLAPTDAPAFPPLIRRPTWYNFYTRAVWYSRQGHWQEAVADFEVALGRRPGAQFPNRAEKRRARTYGLHFLDDYFPHRELGVCLYRLGNLGAAEKELSLSLEQLGSSRARYYLNEVRRARLQTATPPLPKRPVRFQIDLPDGLLVNRPTITIAGTLASPYRVDRVRVNGRPLFVELARKELPIRKRVKLIPGPNVLRLRATDLTGAVWTWRKTITLDLEGPVISVSLPPGRPKTTPATATIQVSDNLGLANIRINGREQSIKPGFGAKRAVLSAPLDQASRLRIEATDRAGNRTRIEVRGADFLKAARQLERLRPERRLAWASPHLSMSMSMTPARLLGRADRFAPNVPCETAVPNRPPQVTLFEVPPRRLAADFALAPTGRPRKKDTDTGKDTLPPRLKLFPDVQDKVRVTTRFYVLDIQAEDGGGIDTVAIDLRDAGREVRNFRDNRSPMCRLTHTIELRPGPNPVHIEVTDLAGNRKTRDITVTRIEDPLWREDLRITLQILPPHRPEPDPLAKTDIYSMLLAALLQDPRRFNIVERDPEVVQRMLLELKLSETRLVDYRRAVKTGKLKPAEWLLQGRISLWSGKNNTDLFGRIIDVDTGREILSADVHFAGNDRQYVMFQLQGFAEKLRQQLPALSARVKAAASNRVKLTAGRRDGIAPGMRFLFISAQEDDPDLADPVEWQGQWIQGRVVQSRDEQCLVELFPKEAAGRIRPDDLAILR